MASSRLFLAIGLVGLTSFGLASACREPLNSGTLGAENQACRPDGTCNAGLTCVASLCVNPSANTGGAGGEGNQTGTGGAEASGGTSNTAGTGNGEAGSSSTGGSGTVTVPELDCRQEGSYLICGNAGVTWTVAQAYCVSKGGALVEIDDGNENDALTELVTEDGSVWIGANDRDSEGDFRWTDGSQVVDAHWADGQPNNADEGENCAVLHASGGDWNDVSCDETEFGGLGMTLVCELL